MSACGFGHADDHEKDYAAAELKATTDLSDTQIAKQVGLPDAEAVKKALRLPQVQGFLSKYLDDAGATLEASAKVIAEGHRATKKTYFSYQGEVCDEREDADLGERREAAKLNLQARGHLKESAATVNMFMDLTDVQLAQIAEGTLDPARLIDTGPRIENPAGAPDGH